MKLLVFCCIAILHAWNYSILSRSPLILQISGFLNDTEADRLIALANPTFVRSSTLPVKLADKEFRTSFSSSLPQGTEDEFVKGIEDKAWTWVNWEQKTSVIPVNKHPLTARPLIQERNQLEPLQVVRYQHGQQFKPHNDWFSAAHYEAESIRGQRVATIFAYLSSAPDDGRYYYGGETKFTKL